MTALVTLAARMESHCWMECWSPSLHRRPFSSFLSPTPVGGNLSQRCRLCVEEQCSKDSFRLVHRAHALRLDVLLCLLNVCMPCKLLNHIHGQIVRQDVV